MHQKTHTHRILRAVNGCPALTGEGAIPDELLEARKKTIWMHETRFITLVLTDTWVMSLGW